MNPIDKIINLLVEFLKYSEKHLLFANLPTSVFTGLFYLGVTYCGYTQLKTRIKLKYPRRLSNHILIFIYSACLVGFLIFVLEFVWLTSFYLKYTYFNGGGWLSQIYFPEPSGWFMNYQRNIIYLFAFFLASRDVLNHVNFFNKKTYLFFIITSIGIISLFIFTPSYAHLDWTYAVHLNFPNEIIFTAFISGWFVKPIFYLFCMSIWKPKKTVQKKQECYTLDVGCGAKPLGTINIDRLIPGDDWTIFDKHDIPNLFVADASYLPFRTEVFSKTYSIHTMEHIVEDLKVYREINRVTKGEIEIRVPFGVWEFFFNNILFWRNYKNWRKKHHVRSYSKKNFRQLLTTVFQDKNIKISYGYPGLLKGLKLEIDRSSKLVFPFPFELIAVIS